MPWLFRVLYLRKALMTRRRSVTWWLGCLGAILSLVGLISQGAIGAQTSLAATQERTDKGDAAYP